MPTDIYLQKDGIDKLYQHDMMSAMLAIELE